LIEDFSKKSNKKEAEEEGVDTKEYASNVD